MKRIFTSDWTYKEKLQIKTKIKELNITNTSINGKKTFQLISMS